MNVNFQILKDNLNSVLAGIILILGLFVLLGWFSHSIALVQVLPEYSPMQFNTAFCFILGSSVILIRNNASLLVIMYLIVVILIAISSLTFVQHILNINSEIDTFLQTPFTTSQTQHPGRMSMMTTSGFLLVSFPIFLLAKKTKKQITLITAILFSILVIALGLGNITGYLLGQSTPYSWSHSGYMAVHTSLGFMLLGFSLYLTLYKIAYKQSYYSYISFTLLPLALLSLTTVIILWTITFSSQNILLNNITEKEVKMFSSEFSELVESHKIAFERMAKRWNRNSMILNHKTWPEDAKDYLNTIIGLKNLLIVDQQGNIRYKITGINIDGLPLDINKLVHNIHVNNSRPEFSENLSHVNTNKKNIILLYYPITFEKKSSGFLIVVYDLKNIIEHEFELEQFNYAIALFDQQKQMHYKSDFDNTEFNIDNKKRKPINMFSTKWNIDFYPLGTVKGNSYHWFVLIFGIIFSCILVLLLYQRHQNQLRSAAISKANNQLLNEVTRRNNVEIELTNHKKNLESIILKRTVEVYKINQDLEDEIDKRKVSESQLIEANSRFEQFSNNTPHVIWLIDVKTRNVIYVNPAFKNIWGYSKEQLYSSPKLWMTKIHPDDIDSVKYKFYAALKGEIESYNAQYRITTVKGETIWIHDHGNPIFNKKGEIIRYAGIAENITLRKNTELALQESEENYRQIVETTDQGIIVIDPMTNIQFINSKMSSLLGMSDKDTINTQINKYIIHDNYKNIDKLFKVPSTESRRLELTFRNKANIKIETKICIMSIFSGLHNKVYKGSLILVTDISQEITAAKEHEALSRQLQQSQKMESIGQLTGGIAHDFNNILSSVLGFTELSLEQNDDKDEILKEYLSEVLIAGERAQELVQQMLTFSRGTAGKLKPLAITPLIKETIKLLRPTIPSSLIIKLDIDKNIPDIKADVVQFHQLLMNLCINARDTMHGIGKLNISLNQKYINDKYCASCFEPINGEYVILAIEDSGEGINPEKIATIFEPFYTTKEVGKGSGMGLSMVHGISHDHNGHIIVHSEQNKGSRFEILFPLNINVMRKTGND